MIVDGLVIGFCYADGAITANAPVKFGTAAANRIPVITCAAAASVGMGVGVALKASATAGDIIPVCFHGIVKVTSSETILIGDLVISGATDATVIGGGASASWFISSTGTQYCLGLALQAATTIGDELLILVGGGR